MYMLQLQLRPEVPSENYTKIINYLHQFMTKVTPPYHPYPSQPLKTRKRKKSQKQYKQTFIYK